MNHPARHCARFSPRLLIDRYLSLALPAAVLALVILACNLPTIAPGSTSGAGPGGSQPAGQGDELDKAMTLDHALSLELDDNRSQVLDQMGPPDAFKITYQLLNGKPVREEEWSYFDDKTRFDFVNGALLWTVNLEPMPDLAVSASTYNPLSFKDGMSVEDVQALLKGQQLLQVSLADYGIPGGQAMAGDQILLGFDGGKLIYVQTFELAPEAGS